MHLSKRSFREAILLAAGSFPALVAGCVVLPTLPSVVHDGEIDSTPRAAHSASAEPAPGHVTGTTQVVTSAVGRHAEQAVYEVSEEAGEALSLQELIAVALRQSPDLAAARYRLAQAEAALARARAEFFPILQLNENYGVTDNPVRAFMFKLNQGTFTAADLANVTNPATIDNFHTQLLVQQTLYTGGRLSATYAAAQHGSVAAAHALQAVRNALIYRVAEAYYRLLQARNLVQVQQQSLRQVQEHLRIVEARFRAGTAVESDVLTVRVRLAETREALIAAQHRYELAWDVLENVIGTTLPRGRLPQRPTPAPWPAEADPLERALEEAIRRRPDLAAIREQLAAARHQVEAARAGNRPTASLVADYDLYTGNLDDGDDSFFAGVMISWNLLDAGRTAAEVEQALARLGQLTAEQRRLLLDIQLQLKKTYSDWVDAKERLAVAEQAVQQAETTLREIEARYKAQAATITQLVDAQVALAQALVRRENAAADVNIARAAVEHAVGRLADVIVDQR